MTTPCPCGEATATNISTNGEDFVEYPCGTEVEVISVTASYSFFYAYNSYNPAIGGWQSGFYRSLLFGWKGGLVDLRSASGGSVTTGQALLDQLTDREIFDSCESLASGSSGFSFADLGGFSPGGIPTRFINVFYNGVNAFGYTAGLNGSAALSRSMQLYRLKITTP